MTPSVWSVLVNFVLAPLGVALLVTAVVLLLSKPARQPVVGLSTDRRTKGRTNVARVMWTPQARKIRHDEAPSWEADRLAP